MKTAKNYLSQISVKAIRKLLKTLEEGSKSESKGGGFALGIVVFRADTGLDHRDYMPEGYLQHTDPYSASQDLHCNFNGIDQPGVPFYARSPQTICPGAMLSSYLDRDKKEVFGVSFFGPPLPLCMALVYHLAQELGIKVAEKVGPRQIKCPDPLDDCGKFQNQKHLFEQFNHYLAEVGSVKLLK